MEQAIIYEQVGAIAKIWLNIPDNANQPTSEMYAQLMQAMERAEYDDNIRVVILQGKGDNFCSGCDFADPSLILAASGRKISFQERRADTRNDIVYWMKLYDMKKPKICGIQGDVMGAGVGLVEICDCVIAADNTKVHNLYFALGLHYSDCLPLHFWKLPMNIAKEFSLTGCPIDAEIGLRHGYFNYVVSPQEVDSACMKLAQRMLRLAPYTLTIHKELADQAYEMQNIRNIIPFAKEAISISLSTPGTPENEAFWAIAKNEGPEALSKFYRSSLQKLLNDEETKI